MKIELKIQNILTYTSVLEYHYSSGSVLCWPSSHIKIKPFVTIFHNFGCITPKSILHYNDVIMSAMASQITSITIIYSTVYSRHRSKKTSKLRVTGLCEGNSLVTGEFPVQRTNNVENASIWWRHHVLLQPEYSGRIEQIPCPMIPFFSVGLYLLSGGTSYRKISRRLEAARLILWWPCRSEIWQASR